MTKAPWMIRLWRAVLCLGGLALAIGAAVLHEVFNVQEMTPGHLVLKLMDATGLGFFIMGALTLILDLEHWRKYYEERLSSIVIGQEYLRELSKDALLKHQIQVFKRYYDNEDIGERGFVRYCLDKIHGYVITPYRDNVHDYISVKTVDSRKLRIVNDLHYNCRKAGGRIQSRIAWQANSSEVVQMESLTLELIWPSVSKKAGDTIAVLELKDLKEQYDDDGSVTFEYNIDQYKDIDDLSVKIKATYVVNQDAFYTWRMIDPSEKVELNISYPPELRLQFKPFLLEAKPSHLIDQSDRPGFFSIAFDSWIMPRSGFAWKLLPAELVKKVEVITPQVAKDPVLLPPDVLVNTEAGATAPAN